MNNTMTIILNGNIVTINLTDEQATRYTQTHQSGNAQAVQNTIIDILGNNTVTIASAPPPPPCLPQEELIQPPKPIFKKKTQPNPLLAHATTECSDQSQVDPSKLPQDQPHAAAECSNKQEQLDPAEQLRRELMQTVQSPSLRSIASHNNDNATSKSVSACSELDLMMRNIQLRRSVKPPFLVQRVSRKSHETPPQLSSLQHTDVTSTAQQSSSETATQNDSVSPAPIAPPRNKRKSRVRLFDAGSTAAIRQIIADQEADKEESTKSARP